MTRLIRLSSMMAVGTALTMTMLLTLVRNDQPLPTILFKSGGESFIYALLEPTSRRMMFTSQDHDMIPAPGGVYAVDFDLFPMEIRVWNMIENNPDRIQATFKFSYDAWSAEVTWAPDGDQFVASVTTGSGGFLYRAWTDGRGETIYTFDSPTSRPNGLHWSPNGEHIMFAARSGIYTIEPDGSNLAEVYYAYNINSTGYPRWSPDGQHILFMTFTGANYCLYTMNADGTDVSEIYCGLGVSDRINADWSPDGEAIAFAMAQVGGTIGLYVGDPHGQGVNRLTQGIMDISYPRWSPGGRHILYTEARSRLVLLDVTRRIEVKLTERGFDGRWLP